MSPSDCGFGLVRRDRVYVLMIHKQRAILTHCPHEMHDLMVASMAHVQTVPGHALLAGPAEGDAFMPVFEEAFPVMEVIEVQAGVAEWRRYRRG